MWGFFPSSSLLPICSDHVPLHDLHGKGRNEPHAAFSRHGLLFLLEAQVREKTTASSIPTLMSLKHLWDCSEKDTQKTLHLHSLPSTEKAQNHHLQNLQNVYGTLRGFVLFCLWFYYSGNAVIKEWETAAAHISHAKLVLKWALQGGQMMHLALMLRKVLKRLSKARAI